MGSKPDKQQETPQQRAMVELAMNKLEDYRQRWLPVQQQLARRIQGMGGAESAQRRQATGAAATEVAAQYAQAQPGVEAALAGSGAGLSSGRAKAALAGLGDDQATSTGLGIAGADQAVDDAYTSALGSLMALGRGEQATAEQGMAHQAALSARTAQNDAALSAANRAGNAQLIGTIGGMGLNAAMSRGPNIPQGFTRQGADVYTPQLNPQAGP